MRNHIAVYLNHFGYYDQSEIVCECCGKPAVDIHHIDARGMGGSNDADKITNLMALCRECHDKYGDVRHMKQYLRECHKKALSHL